MPTAPRSESARARALKRHVWNARQRLLATCAPGLENLLAPEVASLSEVADIVPRPGGVDFTAPFDAVYAALLRWRIAESLRLELVADAAALTFPMLYDQLMRVRWALWLPERCLLDVRVASTKSRLRDDPGLERTLVRAVGAQGIEPVAVDAPALTLRLRLVRDRAYVSLDVGGALHRRHGDKWVTATTIRETTAAGLCAWVTAPRYDLVLDPFCGSGTLIQEACELALGLPAGRDRHVPFEASPAWKATRFAHARRTHGSPGNPDPIDLPVLVASDADADAMRVTGHNLEAAGLRGRVELRHGMAQHLDLGALVHSHAAQRPLLLANPPYGKEAVARGGDADELLRSVVARAAGWEFALLYPRPEALRGAPGVHVDAVHPVVTGGLRNAMIRGRVDPSS